MKPGQCYMLLTVDWFAWVFRVLEQVGPYEYAVEKLSKFDTNAGDVFGEVAADKPKFRERCSWQHFEDDPENPHIIGMGAVGKIAWKGNLPQEDKRIMGGSK